jgi:signal transduction histidine kinase
MAPLPRLRRAPSRTALVAALLLLTLGLAGIMAYQAWDAARSHRRVAEAALKEHALFAAWELSSAIRRDLFSQFMAPGLELVARSGGAYPGAPLKSPELLMKEVEELAWWPARGMLDYVFRYDLDSGRFESSGSMEPTEATRGWLMALVRERAAPDPAGRKKYPWAMVFHGTGTEERVVVLTIEPAAGEKKPIGFGFQTPAGSLIPVFGKIEVAAPLLPPALTRNRPTGDVLSFTVFTRTNRDLFHSRPQYASAYQAGDTVGEAFGGLRVGVALRPEVAESLVIGGLPRSRIPTILGLLVLASGLVLVAIFQLRREQELALLRTDFVSSVSHQLRTPLAQIRMFGETLLLGRVRSEEERKRSLEIIVKEAQSLTQQVDNVLHFSRAQRGQLRLSPQVIHLAPLVQEVLESFCPLAETRDCRVEAFLDETLWGRVDPVAMRQILLNLLDNAVKYGPSEQIVDVKLMKGHPGTVQLQVEDEGEGIPTEERESVFGSYARLDRHRDSGVAGSGIGLAVVRDLARHQGGSVWVEDALSGGARFVVELPRAEPHPAPATATAAEPSDPARGPAALGATTTPASGD